MPEIARDDQALDFRRPFEDRVDTEAMYVLTGQSHYSGTVAPQTIGPRRFCPTIKSPDPMYLVRSVTQFIGHVRLHAKHQPHDPPSGSLFDRC